MHLSLTCRLVSMERPMPSSTTRSAPAAASASSGLICSAGHSSEGRDEVKGDSDPGWQAR